MGLHDLEFRFGQWSGLLQDGVGHADLADVVQAPRQPELLRPRPILAQLERELCRQLTDSRRVFAGVRVAVFRDCREPLERLVVLFFQILRARCDQLLQLGRSDSEQLCLVARRKGVVRDLQRLDPQIGVTIEDRLVDTGAGFTMQQRILESTL